MNNFHVGNSKYSGHPNFPTGRIAMLIMGALAAISNVRVAATESPPQIIDPPLTQFAWASKAVTLKVSITNKLPLTYQWQWNGLDLPNATNKTFHLISAQATNSGEYRVVLANSAGTVTSAVARLTVRDWPQPTGIGFTNLSRLETNIQTLMRTHAVPGAQLAIVKDGRLIATRAYGYADPQNSAELVQSDSLFRIASLSKAITATAVLKLVDDGRLDLDDPVFPLLKLSSPNFPGAQIDPRLSAITVRECLDHTAGWNRYTAKNPDGGVGFDPTFWTRRATDDLGVTNGLTPRDLVRWITGFPLQTKPGTVWMYSNIGYIVARVLIESVTGQPYPQVVQALAAPADITRLRISGETLAERMPDEVVHWLSPLYDVRSEPFWQLPRSITAEMAYYFPVRLRAGPASWTTSALDYARFVTVIDRQPVPPDLVSSNSVGAMLAPSPASRAEGDPYGMGWFIDEITGEIWHGGSGTAVLTIVNRRSDGLIYVMFCNTFDQDLFAALKTTLDSGLAAIKSWPTNDLFPATLSYAAWKAHHFTTEEIAQATRSGDDADPDGDGISNLLEYAQGSDPHLANPEPWLRAKLAVNGEGALLSVEYQRRPLGHAVRYDLESSSDLKSWQPFAGTVTEEVQTDGFVKTTWTEQARGTDATTRFVRVLVQPTTSSHSQAILQRERVPNGALSNSPANP